MKNKKIIFFLCLLLMLGIFLRTYKITEIPPGLHGDEAQSGLEALKILKGAPYTPYSPEVYGQTTLYFYLVAAIFKILGKSATTIRLTSVVLGIATLPLFYFFIKELFDPPTAFLATFFLVTSRWHIHFSRLGLMSVTITLFQSGLFLFLFKGLKTKKLLHFFLAGLFFTLGLNTYMGFRLIPLILIIWFLFLFFLSKKQITKNKINLGVFLIATLLFSAPLINYAFKNWSLFMGRMDSIWIFNTVPENQVVSAIWENLRGTVLSFHFLGSTWAHKNLPGAPLLDPISGIFFLVGLVAAFIQFKKPAAFLLLINFFFMSAASVLSTPVYPPAMDPIRSSGALVSVIAFSGLGASLFWQKFKKGQIIMVFLLFLVLAINFRAYFSQFAHHSAIWHDFHTVPCKVAEVANQNPGAYIYLLSDWFYSDYLSIKFLAPDFEGEDFFKQLGKYSPKESLLPLKHRLQQDAIFVVLPFYDRFLDHLKTTYPQGEIKKHFDGPDKKLIFTTFSIPKNVLQKKALAETYH